ncbi:hypothetical protein [Rhodococcus rhodnii]|uniref:Uncharacterized protein n=1 Tax=Rhodococcus rhodnii LMG 5362 TaxID=1273125 RepID=R7WPE2_9NOCA|nr:hypothetical protein [Rhodococcus rhodnii]EOM75834.1 hypothetical protein Rrhod_2740 [Rhodococcus rhodnii LMG 5362]
MRKSPGTILKSSRRLVPAQRPPDDNDKKIRAALVISTATTIVAALITTIGSGYWLGLQARIQQQTPIDEFRRSERIDLYSEIHAAVVDVETAEGVLAQRIRDVVRARPSATTESDRLSTELQSGDGRQNPGSIDLDIPVPAVFQIEMASWSESLRHLADLVLRAELVSSRPVLDAVDRIQSEHQELVIAFGTSAHGYAKASLFGSHLHSASHRSGTMQYGYADTPLALEVATERSTEMRHDFIAVVKEELALDD